MKISQAEREMATPDRLAEFERQVKRARAMAEIDGEDYDALDPTIQEKYLGEAMSNERLKDRERAQLDDRKQRLRGS